MGETLKIEEQFLGLVSRTNWSKDTLSSEDEGTLVMLLTAAGFGSVSVAKGQLRGHWRDQDGSSTGDTYPINCICSYKAVLNGKDDYLATGWLDSMVRLSNDYQGDKEKALTMLAEQIKLAHPLKPVVLTEIGDALSENPPRRKFGRYDYFLDHSNDDSALSTSAGTHAACNGSMDRHAATPTHDSISCRKCHLRVAFPKTIKTYGDLRRHFDKFNQ